MCQYNNNMNNTGCQWNRKSAAQPVSQVHPKYRSCLLLQFSQFECKLSIYIIYLNHSIFLLYLSLKQYGDSNNINDVTITIWTILPYKWQNSRTIHVLRSDNIFSVTFNNMNTIVIRQMSCIASQVFKGYHGVQTKNNIQDLFKGDKYIRKAIHFVYIHILSLIHI